MPLIYVIGDGDNIRQRMEQQLLYGKLDECKKVSEAITAGMRCVNDVITARKGWEVVFCGGDDILVKVCASDYDPNLIRKAIDEFERCSKSTICFGSASSLQEAYLNLRRAKSFGVGILVCETEKSTQ
ncbi:MAG: mCpol domain-containing protein [Methylococcaceae bacterium]|nr:MAG: mCpol domain-containing protein [Methylococcaceae bacterium]